MLRRVTVCFFNLTLTVMKKYLFFYLFLVFALPSICVSQDYYDITYDIGYYDHPKAFVSDSLGNIVVCGWFTDADTTFTKAFAIKVNPDGQEVWRITLADTSKYYAVCVTSTGNIALSGSKNNHCFLSMVDAQNGTELWSYTEDTVTGYWFGTVNEFFDQSEYRLLSFKTTNGVHPIVSYVFNSITGNYISKSQDNSNNNLTPVYTSNNVAPNIIWAGSDMPVYDFGLVITENYAGGSNGLWTFSALHIAGVEKYSDTQGCVIRLFDWGPNEFYLGVLVMRFINSNVYGNAFQIVHDNFNLAGSGMIDGEKILVTGTIDNELALWFVDHDLTSMEEKILPTNNPRAGIDVLGLPGDDMVIMGKQSYTNSDATDLFLMKLDSDGTVSVRENETAGKVTVFPNPTSDKIFIKNAEGHKVKLLLINASGKVVKTVSDNNFPVSLKNMPKGLYLAIIYIDGKLSGKEKIVKL